MYGSGASGARRAQFSWEPGKVWEETQAPWITKWEDLNLERSKALNKNKTRLIALLVCGAILIASEVAAWHFHAALSPESVDVQATVGEKKTHLIRGKIEKGISFAGSLKSAGLSEETTKVIVAVLKEDGNFNFRRCRIGDRFAAGIDDEGAVHRFSYQVNPLTRQNVELSPEGELKAQIVKLETQLATVVLRGSIENSFYESIVSRGELIKLAGNVAKVFEYDIDFALEPRKGDTYRILLDRITYKDAVVDYGHIHAAEYVGEASGTVRAYWFAHEDPEIEAYYNEKGIKLKKFLLRAPLNSMRLTSRFGWRIHPISKRRQFHKGVDYGAPTGTPVWAVADGVVSRAGRAKGYGKLVTIKHRGGISTRYGHLSRISVKRGQKVRQRQMIGRVGSTGYSTGPHLHYELRLKGKPINPRKLKVGTQEVLPKKLMPELEKIIADVDAKWENTAVLDDGSTKEGIFH